MRMINISYYECSDGGSKCEIKASVNMQLKQRKNALATGKEYQDIKLFCIDGMVLLSLI